MLKKTTVTGNPRYDHSRREDTGEVSGGEGEGGKSADEAAIPSHRGERADEEHGAGGGVGHDRARRIRLATSPALLLDVFCCGGLDEGAGRLDAAVPDEGNDPCGKKMHKFAFCTRQTPCDGVHVNTFAN